MRSFKTPALAVTLAAALAACSSSSSTGTTGGSCLAEAETCTGTADSCCTGLICSPAVGVCLSSQGSGPGVSATTIGGTTHGATTSNTAGVTTSSQFSSTTSGPGSTTSGQFTSGTTSGQQSNTTSGQFSGTTTGPGSTTSGQFSSTTSGPGSTTSGQFTGTTSGTSSGVFTSGTTSGHVTTSGSSTSGTSGSSGYAGGCQPASYFATEFGGCADGGTICGCGQTCVLDTLFEQGVCEEPCTTNANCPDTLTTCQGGTCKFAQCSPVYSTCATGYCDPFDFGTEIDLCDVPGTLGLLSSCSLTSNFANDPSANCSAGMACLGPPGATTGICDTLCDPADNTTCPSATCANGDSANTSITDIGYCSDGGF